MVTARATTPITATAINQVSHSTPSKPNNRPSRQMCADMTPLPGLQPLHQGTRWEAHLVLAPGTPRPSAVIPNYTEECLASCELSHRSERFKLDSSAPDEPVRTQSREPTSAGYVPGLHFLSSSSTRSIMGPASPR